MITDEITITVRVNRDKHPQVFQLLEGVPKGGLSEYVRNAILLAEVWTYLEEQLKTMFQTYAVNSTPQEIPSGKPVIPNFGLTQPKITKGPTNG